MNTPSAFHRLAPFIQEFIYRASWEELRPLQVAAIDAILDTPHDLLIMASTASGKTEAAFLPILSLLHEDAGTSVRVLYISPLRALINDQFQRMEVLCEQGNIPVHRWHGDVGATHKADVLKHPRGILQITPESIESLFINKPERLQRLFQQLTFIVIDEVHTFLESDRGIQLRTHLERLSSIPRTGRPRRIGLSATIGDPPQTQHWLNPHMPQNVHIIDAPAMKQQMMLSHMHVIPTAEPIPAALIDDLYQLTYQRKTLIFCNRRHDVEILTSELNRRCVRDRFDERYYPHHGSLSKDIREDAESRMRIHTTPQSIICTNTLELGIDIGHLDLVVQINSTHSVMSFVQRLGRSGRRVNTPRIMQLYTIDALPHEHDPFYLRFPWNLLKAVAITSLAMEGWNEPPVLQQRSYNVLYHQILSRLAQTNGCFPRDLVAFFINTGVYSNVTPDDYYNLLSHMAAIDHLQQLPTGELIIGLTGERIVRSRDFYAVFQTPPEWTVLYNERVIGRIAPSPDIQPELCLLLAGQVWLIKDVLPDQQVVLVIPSHQARNVLFQGFGIPAMHPRIAERVRTLLHHNHDLPALSENGQRALFEARHLFHTNQLVTQHVRKTTDGYVIFPWTGSQAMQTLRYLIQSCGFAIEFPGFAFPWVIKIIIPQPTVDIRHVFQQALERSLEPRQFIDTIAIELLRTQKFDEFLPDVLLRQRAIDRLFDIPEAQRVLRRLIAGIG